MAFSLSNWFKGKDSGEEGESEGLHPDTEQTAAPAAPQPVPSSVRTVTPSTSHSPQQQAPVSLRDPSARPPISLSTAKPPASRKVTAVARLTRKVPLVVSAAPVTPVEPPRAAPAFMPTAPDVTVSLEVGDFLDRLPSSFLQEGSFDRHRKVDFQASELYSDLAKGRASVPASVIYRRCPEIFSRPVSDTEDVEVQLPLQKLVEQMGMALSTRDDQFAEENVGEIETPFLQVAMEDNARLPTAAGSAAGAVRPPAGLNVAAPFRPGVAPAETGGEPATVRPQRPGPISTISPVKVSSEPPVAPPTASTTGPISNGKRPPSTVRASVAGGKIRLSSTVAPPRVLGQELPEVGSGDEPPSTNSQRIGLPMQPASPSHEVAKKTARIQIPPISLRAPGNPKATPRPGAVPPPPSTPIPPAPAGSGRKETPRPITFRTSPPPPSVKPAPPSFAPPKGAALPPPSFPAVPPAAASITPALAPADDRKISLGLAAILRGLPPSMLAVEPSTVPDEVRVTLPFGTIEPQLSQGRVTIKRDLFLASLPEAHREVLSGDDEAAEIPIPLQEVFQNLPDDALTMRVDQVKDEPGVLYPTPFSQKADEDAQRFASPAVSPPAADTPEETVAENLADVPLTPAPAPSSTDVQLPADSAPERDRDIPLDLEGGAPGGLPPLLVETPAPALETPVEVPDTVVVEDHRSQETPAAESPAPVVQLPPLTPAPSVAPVAAAEPPPEPPAAEKSEEPFHQPSAAAPEPAAPAVVKEKPVRAPAVAAAPDTALQTLFMTEEELDAKSVVKLVSQLPSVTGCAVMFEDGLRLAGNFPDGDAQGFSAMAAPFFKRAARFVSELELGSLQTFTMHTEHGLLSFFMHDKICVGVRHTGRGFMPGVREKLEIVTRELARMYSTAKPGQAVE